ncbi:DEAD/DEAH box helicase [Thermosulfurimonas marina]|uniref:DEAD/DEAH box helicase n=1 Tax=Thermosulfurimonas marina TaxID=2047767 RepID=A0A6H1WRR0_9BACT|nr:DEAD/DEAH box helicase [Thermosulfurimonas marina]QJA05907.1 DEAD/DEAH box helicase [Thermosulfurimonas marina]
MESGAGEIKALAVPLHGRPLAQFPLHPLLKERLSASGITRTTILQDLAFSEVLRGRDLILRARRGSGKGLLTVLWAANRLLSGNGNEEARPVALVVTSSPERARALADWARRLLEGLEHRVAVFSGEGPHLEAELPEVEKGPHLLFTTPDGLSRLLKWNLLRFHGLRLLVVDELEVMVSRSQTFVRQLLGKLPPPDRRQTLVLLGDLSYPALEVAAEITREPEEIYVEEGRRDFSGLKLAVIHVSEEEKWPLLLGILRQKGWPRALIFVNEKVTAQRLTDDLKAVGLKAAFLKPELPLPLRLNFLKGFARGDYRLLVATDAGCRFIQDPELELIINYDLPEVPSDFLQRAARIRKESGEILSLCDETGAFFLEAIEELLGRRMEVLYPEPEEEWLVSPALVREELGGKGAAPRRRPRPGKGRPRSRR